MKIARVQYTISQEFVATNTENIEEIVDELKKIGNIGESYSTFYYPMKKRSSTLINLKIRCP